MEFVDKLGHIFSLPSYSDNPIGYEYNENNYVFWFEREYNYSPSVNNYYFKQINIFLLSKEIEDLEITVNSNVFSLLSYQKINELNNVHDSIRFKPSDFVNKLTLVDCNTIQPEEGGLLVSFYVVAYADESAVWESNVLIKAQYKADPERNIDTWYDWCPITVGIETVDECEELVINGKNMGVSLPKEIIKAVYQSGYFSENPDESLYKAKLKEYLMNYMSIKGQQGNMKSIKDSLAWFGWGDKITISKLIKTDVDLHNIYIRDYFDIESDIIYQYKCFKNTSLISLSLQGNEEISMDPQNFDAEFWGEGKPIYKDLFAEHITVNYEDKYIDEIDNTITEYQRAYYDYSITEIGLKLCILKYYFEKYFVPLHVKVNTVSVEYSCHMNDIKYITRPFTCVNEAPLFINNYAGNTNVVDYISVNVKEINKDNIVDYYTKEGDEYILADKDNINTDITNPSSYNYVQYYKLHNAFIKFPNTHILYFTDGEHYVDDNFNEFYYYKDKADRLSENIYFVNDTVVTIPIDFPHNIDEDQTFECVMTLTKDNKEVFVNHFTFCEKAGKPDTYYQNLILRPATFNRNKKWDLNDWLNSNYNLTIFINGNFYTYDFTLRMPDFYIRMGKLVYQWDDKFDTFEGDRTFMYNPKLVTINNLDFYDDTDIFANNENDVLNHNLEWYFNRYYKSTVNITNNKKYFNICHLFEKTASIPAKYLNYYTKYNITEYPNTQRILLVSKLPVTEIEKYQPDTNYDIIEEPKTITGWVRSDYKVLINRLKFESTDINKDENNPDKPTFATRNVFETDDIIAFYLFSNENLYYKLRLGTKWHIEPLSLRMSEASDVESPNEMAIVSVGRDNIRYERGYYNITCRYSLDDYIQHEYTATAKFKVK